MKKLSKSIWPNLKPIIENKIDELKSEIDIQKRLINQIIKDQRKEHCYQAKIDNYDSTILKLKAEYNEFESALNALLSYEITNKIFENLPLVPSNEEILQFENLENDKLYAGRGVIFDESEDLNDC